MKLLLVFCYLSATVCLNAADSDIRVSSIGFLNASTKQATLMVYASSFSINRESDNSVAYSGTLTGPALNADTSETVYNADFSSLTETGRFYVAASGVGRSVNFSIAPDAFNMSLYLHMLGFYGQRCGTAVNVGWRGHSFIHAACHLNDGYLDYVGQPGVLKNGEKGWHDAGDFGKYVVNAGISVGCMLQAWEQFPAALTPLQLPIPEHGGPIPDYLAEIKWETDWLLTMQFADGSVSHS